MNEKPYPRWLRALCELLCRCSPSEPEPEQPSPIPDVDRAARLASQLLVSLQSEDGSWRAAQDPELENGFVLTGLALRALRSVPQPAEASDAVAMGFDYLETLVKDGKVDFGSTPIVLSNAAAANALYVLSESKRHRGKPAVTALVSFLCNAQYTEEVGYVESDVEYGGFGYRAAVKKGSDAERVPELDFPHLGATLLVVEALAASRSEAARGTLEKARRFVERCQNFAGEKPGDGGFVFSPAIAELNKAGADESTPTGFRSYGTMTANGLRLLALLGYERQDRRFTAAADWLSRNFRADRVPGEFPPDRDEARASIYFYYVWTVAHALDLLGESTLSSEGRVVHWAVELAERLVRIQLPDGVWRNQAAARKENIVPVGDLVSLPALAICRKYLV